LKIWDVMRSTDFAYSYIGPIPTCRDVRCESVIGGWTDVTQTSFGRDWPEGDISGVVLLRRGA